MNFLHRHCQKEIEKLKKELHHWKLIIADGRPTIADLENRNHLDVWIVKGIQYFPEELFLVIQKNRTEKSWYSYSLIGKSEWHNLQTRIPLKGEKVLVRKKDGTTFEWKYGNCGSPDCRCDLRDNEFKVIE